MATAGDKTLGVRLDEETMTWLKDYESSTGVTAVSMVRGLVSAARRFEKEHGYLAFPLVVVPPTYLQAIEHFKASSTPSSQTAQKSIMATSSVLSEKPQSYTTGRKQKAS